MSDNLPAPRGALDVIGVDLANPDLPRLLSQMPTEKLEQALMEEAESFKAQTEIWKRRVGCVLWVLRKRLDSGAYGQVVERFACATGFGTSSLYRWRQSAEVVLGALPSGAGRPRNDTKRAEEFPTVGNSDPFAADDEVAEAELVEEEDEAPIRVDRVASVRSNGTRRQPLVDTARNAGWEFRKAVERLERIAADDRFSANREQVAEQLNGHLSYAIEVCQNLMTQLERTS